jgi:hypothetical protein
MDSRSRTPEIPDSQAQEPSTPLHSQVATTSRDNRIAIRTALQFSIPYAKIEHVLGVTERQILYAKKHPITPQHRKAGRKPALRTPQKTALETWLLQSPSHRRLRYDQIPFKMPLLQGIGSDAIHTAMKSMGYVRRTTPKKGFSNDPAVKSERLEFAEEGITWDRTRLYNQMFSDEVWAMGGAHTVQYVTVKEDGSDTFLPETVTRKFSKAPAWMFHGTIIGGRKGPAVFWEKEWGKMKSSTYDSHILVGIEAFLQTHPNCIFMQDNASCHRSRETQRNLQQRGIPTIRWPRYSPDLNIIEHVWNWMKNWIQEQYWQSHYEVTKIPLGQLRTIIWEAWHAVPDTYIESLFDSWWRRCQAVINAQGGPTKY